MDPVDNVIIITGEVQTGDAEMKHLICWIIGHKWRYHYRIEWHNINETHTRTSGKVLGKDCERCGKHKEFW